MSLKKCPKCGIPIVGLDKCPICGYDNNSTTYSYTHQETTVNVNNGSNKRFNLTIWETSLLICANVSVISIIVNLILGGIFWSLYTTLAIFSIYFLMFTCWANNIKKFLTRFRNSIFLLNAILFIIFAISKIIKDDTVYVLINYYVPINLIVANTVAILLLTNAKISVASVMHALFMMLVQSITLFIIYLTGFSNPSTLSKILIIVALGVNLITVINIAFIRVSRIRNNVNEVFKWWE